MESPTILSNKRDKKPGASSEGLPEREVRIRYVRKNRRSLGKQEKRSALVQQERCELGDELNPSDDLISVYRFYTGQSGLLHFFILASKPFFSIHPTLHRPLVPSGLI